MKGQWTDWMKFGVFAVVAALLCAYLAITLAQLRVGPSTTYHALFANASGLKKGSPVRIAGVDVGRISKVSLNDGGNGASAVKVDFSVASGVQIPDDVRATVRFKNLIGDQYLQLDRGAGQPGLLRADATIPSSRTRAALDLDTLFSGFQPLFAGLDPAQINRLSGAVVSVLEGQQGAVAQLLATISDLFGTLAQNDDLINQVVTNLNVALGSLAKDSQGIGNTIDQLQGLVSGLAQDRKPIGASLAQINTLAASAAALLVKVRPPLKDEVPALDAIATSLNNKTDTLDVMLRQLPGRYDSLIRAGSYGSFFNFYLCGLRFKLTGPTGAPTYTPWTVSDLARCQKQ